MSTPLQAIPSIKALHESLLANNPFYKLLVDKGMNSQQYGIKSGAVSVPQPLILRKATTKCDSSYYQRLPRDLEDICNLIRYGAQVIGDIGVIDPEIALEFQKHTRDIKFEANYLSLMRTLQSFAKGEGLVRHIQEEITTLYQRKQNLAYKKELFGPVKEGHLSLILGYLPLDINIEAQIKEVSDFIGVDLFEQLGVLVNPIEVAYKEVAFVTEHEAIEEEEEEELSVSEWEEGEFTEEEQPHPASP